MCSEWLSTVLRLMPSSSAICPTPCLAAIKESTAISRSLRTPRRSGRSPTATTRHGSLPPRACALFFTSDASFNKSFGSLQSFICVVYENIDKPSPDETGCLLFLRKDQGEVSEKRAMVEGSGATPPRRLRSIALTLLPARG